MKKPHLRPPSGQIADRVKSLPLDENPQLRLSFKHLDLVGNAKFSLLHCGETYLQKLLERLRDLSMTHLNTFKNLNNALRAHPIDFAGTTEIDGFTSLNAQLRESECWQFQITSNQHGRLHGILIGDTFYVVWVDPCHLLYSQRDWCDSHPRP